jgi:hypothetical protein
MTWTRAVVRLAFVSQRPTEAPGERRACHSERPADAPLRRARPVRSAGNSPCAAD